MDKLFLPADRPLPPADYGMFFLFIYYFYTDNELLGAMWRTLLSPF
jgi:hypothetical protein